jgi:phosphatidylinositol alpha-1,6-mannosyltransferase
VLRQIPFGSRIVTTVGRLEERKGQDTVIRILPRILSAIPDAHYLIVGTGRYKRFLENLAKSTGVLEHVTFAGHIPDECLKAVYGSADLFALVNRELPHGDVEGFGIALIEAAAFGCPIVTGRSGGTFAAVKEGVSALLVDPTNEGEVADAMIKLLGNPALRRKMGEAGRDFVRRKFSWDKSALQMQSLLAKVANGERWRGSPILSWKVRRAPEAKTGPRSMYETDRA